MKVTLTKVRLLWSGTDSTCWVILAQTPEEVDNLSDTIYEVGRPSITKKGFLETMETAKKCIEAHGAVLLTQWGTFIQALEYEVLKQTEVDIKDWRRVIRQK